MDERTAREEICRTGRELLATGLVARTWGNVSCRLDDGSFLITPSGLDYTRTGPEDIVRVELPDLRWQGARKPSSEKGIHAAAYELFPEAGFVIHTHQSCATALGLAGFESMSLSREQREALGGLARADYGLPGTKRLKNAVRAAMATGAETVLMRAHGAVICGKDRAQAMARAELLERLCREALKPERLSPDRMDGGDVSVLLDGLSEEFPNLRLADGDRAVAWANTGRPLRAQLDDMAQMLGSRVETAAPDRESIAEVLRRRGAVLAPGLGVLVNAADPEDAEALRLLTEKAALCALHCEALGVGARLPAGDAALMRLVYLKKYSKQKDR